MTCDRASSQMRRWLAALMVVIGVVAVVPATPAAAQTVPPVAIRIVDHPLDVAKDGLLRLVVRVSGEVPDGASVVVRVYTPVTTRERLRAALDGDTGPTQDRITLRWADLVRTPAGEIEIPIPTTSGPARRGLLRMARSGVYPLRLELRAPARPGTDGPVIGDIVTVAHSLEATDGEFADDVDVIPLDVAYVATLTAPPARRSNGTTLFDSRARRSLEDLAELLTTATVPLSVAVPPEFVDALVDGSDDDVALWEQLSRGLATRDVLAVPAVTLDPATAVRSGLNDVYTSLLRRGEDTLSELVGRGRVQRNLHVVTDEIDLGGAALIRDLGTRAVVLSPRAQRRMSLGSGTSPSDPTLLVALSLGSNSELPAALVDTALAELMTRTEGDPLEQALALVAELLVIRGELVGSAGDELRAADVLNGRSIVLSTDDGSLADTTLLNEVLQRLQRTTGLRLVTASQAAATTGLAIANGLVVNVDLPRQTGRDLSRRGEDIFMTLLDVYTVASMLTEGDPRTLQWEDLLWRLVAMEYDDEAVLEGLGRVRTFLDQIRQSIVVPSLNDVTLGGRRSTIRLKLRNEGDVDVRIAVRLESAKLSFPEGQKLVALPARTTTEVDIPVEVRSNGRFPVSVTLVTPDGDVPLGPPVEFAARATALTGLGQVVTVAGILILASWWFRHARARRRIRPTQGVV